MGWSIFFDGVSAFATAGALIAAVAAGVQAKRLYVIESTRDEQSKEVARRLHATQISSWAAMEVLPSGALVYGVVIRNSSDDPVYDARVTGHGFTTEKTPTLRCVPPGEYFVANKDRRKSDGRLYRWGYMQPLTEIDHPVRPFTASDSRGVDELTFRDNSGVAWSRTARGSLSRI